MSKNKEFMNQLKTEKRPYGKYLLYTGGAVFAIWALRKVPWRRVVDPATLSSLRDTLVSVTERLEEMGKEYLNGPVAGAVGHTKQIAEKIASSTSAH